MSFRVLNSQHTPVIQGAFVNFITAWAQVISGTGVGEAMTSNLKKYGDAFFGLKDWAMINYNIQIDIIYGTDDNYYVKELIPSPCLNSFVYTNPKYDIDPFIGPRTHHQIKRTARIIKLTNELDNNDVDPSTDKAVKQKTKLQQLLNQIKGHRFFKPVKTPEVRLYQKHITELSEYYKLHGREKTQFRLKKMGYESAEFVNNSRKYAEDFIITLDKNCLTPEHEAVLFVMKFCNKD